MRFTGLGSPEERSQRTAGASGNVEPDAAQTLQIGWSVAEANAIRHLAPAERKVQTEGHHLCNGVDQLRQGARAVDVFQNPASLHLQLRVVPLNPGFGFGVRGDGFGLMLHLHAQNPAPYADDQNNHQQNAYHANQILYVQQGWRADGDDVVCRAHQDIERHLRVKRIGCPHDADSRDANFRAEGHVLHRR